MAPAFMPQMSTQGPCQTCQKLHYTHLTLPMIHP
jgi:hypothetical protein